jgi:hypothetical protein
MKAEKLKDTKYPILAFRISEAEKGELMVLVEYIHAALRKRQADDEKVFRKNDVMIEAMFRGLRQMKAKL